MGFFLYKAVIKLDFECKEVLTMDNESEYDLYLFRQWHMHCRLTYTYHGRLNHVWCVCAGSGIIMICVQV